jgi:hypothetical protein
MLDQKDGNSIGRSPHGNERISQREGRGHQYREVVNTAAPSWYEMTYT